MLVLECTWRRGDTDFAMLDDAVGVRGRTAYADGVYYGVWRRAGNTLLVCGGESEWASRDVELIPGHRFRVVDADPGLTGHVEFAVDAVRSRHARQVFSTPHGVDRLAPGERPDSYVAHVEWGPRPRPLAILPGPEDAPWEDAIRWAGRWAHTALVRHADRPAERLTLNADR